MNNLNDILAMNVQKELKEKENESINSLKSITEKLEKNLKSELDNEDVVFFFWIYFWFKKFEN